MKKDTVYAKPHVQLDKFEFDAQVADVFENMINRSIPGYRMVLDLIGLIAEQYGTPETNCYDLGCSLGASTLMVRRNVPGSCHVVGVDNSPAMVERCRANVARDHSEASVDIIEADIRDVDYEDASVVVMNYTLQFLDPEARLPLLRKIGNGTIAGGVLILSEKIRFADTAMQEAMAGLHHEFKRHQGYSDLEISQKRAALENVLIPDTEEEHITRLLDAGFTSARMINRSINFSTFIGIREA